MKIDKAIKSLVAIQKKLGNVDIWVDTEAGIFPCHMVDIENIWPLTSDVSPDGKNYCYITLDPEVMKKVHPMPHRVETSFKKWWSAINIADNSDRGLEIWSKLVWDKAVKMYKLSIKNKINLIRPIKNNTAERKVK